MATQLGLVADRDSASVSHRDARPRRRVLRTTIVAVSLALIVAAPTEATTRVLPGSDSTGQASAATAGQRIDAKDNERADAYWTADRMKNSIPADLHVNSKTDRVAPVERGPVFDVKPAKPVATTASSALDARPSSMTTAAATASEGYWQYSNTANPNAQIGHLFFQGFDAVSRTWKNYNCSATVVGSGNKSVVWTAGHCVFETFSNQWNKNYRFCPGYRNGSCPFGVWTPYWQATTTQWQNATCSADAKCFPNEFQYDFGVLKMNVLNGYRIQERVGAHGIKFNGPSVQTRYLFGYPMNKTSGEYLYFCYATNTVVAAGNLQMGPCTAGGGASGGPWLSEINSSWLGYVHSVNSNGPTGAMVGPYQGTVAQALYTSNAN